MIVRACGAANTGCRRLCYRTFVAGGWDLHRTALTSPAIPEPRGLLRRPHRQGREAWPDLPVRRRPITGPSPGHQYKTCKSGWASLCRLDASLARAAR